LADDPAEVESLIELCQAGRIYAVETWIAEGRPIQASAYIVGRRGFYGSPLTLAMETHQHDLLVLLLCNGYQLERESVSPVERALEARRWDLLELFLEWGADASRVDPETVLATYRTDLFDRFWAAGVDYTKDDCLARYVAKTTSNRPLYGWVRRHRDEPRIQRALALALVQAVWDGREKAVHLLRWAGADPHVKVPLLEWHDAKTPDEDEDLYTAVQMAVGHGGGKLLRVLPVDAQRDNLDELWAEVRDPDAVDHLMVAGPPSDWSRAILHNVYWITNDLFADRASENRWCLERIAHYGGRLTTIDRVNWASLRRDLSRMSRPEARRWLLHWLSNPRYCDPSIYGELVRTPRMQEILKEAGISGHRAARLVERWPEDPRQGPRRGGRS
jgi:hypothetical protein